MNCAFVCREYIAARVHIRQEEVQWSGHSIRHCREAIGKGVGSGSSLTRPLQKLPASDLLLASPVDVDDVALAAIRALQDDYYFGIFNIEQIKEMAKA